MSKGSWSALDDLTDQLLKSWRIFEISKISCVRRSSSELDRHPMKQQKNSYFHSNRGCRMCVPCGSPRRSGRAAKMQAGHGCLPTWEVCRYILLAKMSRNPLGLQLHRSYWSVSREYAVPRLRVNDHAAISNCSECATSHPGSTLHVGAVRSTSGRGDTNAASQVRCPVHLHRRHRLRGVRSRRVSCRSHAGNRSGSCGLLSH